MRMSGVLVLCFIITGSISAREIVTNKQYDRGRIEVEVKKGSSFFHKLSILPFISIKTPPQIAVWLETTDGRYLDTLFVTRKSATQSWSKAPGDQELGRLQRNEALPLWSHRRNIVNENGTYMPTREKPVSDSVSSASPKGDFQLAAGIPALPEKVYVYIEINASCDFNDYYTADCKTGDPGYSGGRWGSGQPAVIYRALVDTENPDVSSIAEYAGYASADGSTGEIYPGTEHLTTALSLVQSITVTLVSRRK